MAEHRGFLGQPVRAVCVAALIGLAVAGLAVLVRYALLLSMWPLITVTLVEVLFLLAGLAALHCDLPMLLLPVAVAGMVLGFTTNHPETTMFNALFYVQAVIAGLAVITGTIVQWRMRVWPSFVGNKAGQRYVAAVMVILLVSIGAWQASAAIERSTASTSAHIWAVPFSFEQTAEHPGTLKRISYQTKAYATDSRDVIKHAYVYLPYGYDDSKQYDILYLLHGTGDDESYWLNAHDENKRMVDQFIERGIAKPMIIVTPTFYVENDAADDLDRLTYSFAKELRNDLMPAVESQYSTYATTADDEGFVASRDHRAFAGLSRGAVTTYHSVLCQSLDYFSWFGTFSGSRTSADDIQSTIQRGKFADYSIHYLYASTGTFDFAMPGQLDDYRALLAVEPRLQAGVNTRFDVFPMRYHSSGNWHLALYNFLQYVFA